MRSWYSKVIALKGYLDRLWEVDMNLNLIFVHGWSVTSTETYGNLPTALEEAAPDDLELDIQHIHLGRYISFHDEVTLDDIARALNSALHDLPGNKDSIQKFSCITHSTGGPVVRQWINHFYGRKKPGDPLRLDILPLEHLIMLAPANHGSSLATLGKKRVGRIKAWASGVEPGQRVLDWLSLGSEGQWKLNRDCLGYESVENGHYPFVLTGEGIDRKLYDFLNSYLTESGSDGVIRVAGANMNYSYVSLIQDNEVIKKEEVTVRGNKKTLTTYNLAPEPIEVSKPTCLRIYPDYSHTGDDMGIMQHKMTINDPVVIDILRCLNVKSAQDYEKCSKDFSDLNKEKQLDKNKHVMVVFNVHDDKEEALGRDDFDILLMAGDGHKLPSGFLTDKQINKDTNNLVYYINMEKIKELEGNFGIRVVARPDDGFSYYYAGEYRFGDKNVSEYLQANETMYIDITLRRIVDKNVFKFSPADANPNDFKEEKPSGKEV